MSDISTGLAMFEQIINRSEILGVTWIIPLVIAFVSCVVVTRRAEDWKRVFFPICVGWMAAGLQIHIVPLIIGGVIFVIDTLSMETIGGMMEVFSNRSKQVRKQARQQLRSLEKSVKPEVSIGGHTAQIRNQLKGEDRLKPMPIYRLK